SDVGSRVPADRMILWSLPYRLIAPLSDTNRHETQVRAQLSPLRAAPGPLAPAEAERILAAVQALRMDTTLMFNLSRVFLVGVRRNDAWPTRAAQARVLGDLRAKYGACVQTPSIAG